MTSAFDPRIVRVGIQIENDFLVFENVDIRVQGQKFASPTQNVCNVKISNLTRAQRNYILTKATPISSPNKPNITPIYVTVDVGRQSYGTFRLFEGECYASTVTHPPDIGIMLRSLTNSFALGVIEAVSFGAITPLQTIAQTIADKNGLILNYRVKENNKSIANFSCTGAVGRLIEKLQLVGNIRAYVDNKTLIITDKAGFSNDTTFNLSMETGMVGVPQATESGATAVMLIDPRIQIGGRVAIKSQINPAVNGDNYNVTQLTFDVANRDNPFFYTLLCSNWALAQGTT